MAIQVNRNVYKGWGGDAMGLKYNVYDELLWAKYTEHKVMMILMCLINKLKDKCREK